MPLQLYSVRVQAALQDPCIGVVQSCNEVVQLHLVSSEQYANITATGAAWLVDQPGGCGREFMMADQKL